MIDQQQQFWRSLVHENVAEQCVRTKIPNWKFGVVNIGTILLLRPALNSKTRVIARVLSKNEEQRPTNTADLEAWQARVWNQVPTINVMIRVSGQPDIETTIPCDLALKCLSSEHWDDTVRNTTLLTDDDWNHTRELPEMPGVLQPSPCKSVVDMRKELALPEE